jgi:predicted amidohydrolase YtcJ
MPTLEELDRALPDHPVLMLVGQGGPSATNTPGKKFLESKGVAVDAQGGIATGKGGANPSVDALDALRAIQTFEDQKRGTLDVMAYSLSVGLVTHGDQSGSWPAVRYEFGPNRGKPAPWKDLVEVTAGTAQSFDPWTSYDAVLELHRQGKLAVRLRLFFSSKDETMDLPYLTQRLNNQFPDFGDDWIRVSGMGENISGGDKSKPNPLYEKAAGLVAAYGWGHNQHGQGPEDEREITAAWERVNAKTPIAGLRWCLAHVANIERETVERLKAIGAGVCPNGAGRAPLRMLVDSGIHVAFGGDGAGAGPINPWVHMQYMVTGKTASGQVQKGQALTRLEALRLYTLGSAWFSKDENDLGSIEVGKYGDLAVLSDDFLDPARVPDDAIRRISSVLTIVDGKIVHDTGVLKTK